MSPLQGQATKAGFRKARSKPEWFHRMAGRDDDQD